MTSEKVEAPATQGMVLICDGGARPNPGDAGWGLHGYLYSTAVPKKGTGNSTHVPTESGYKLKSSGAAQVTPIHYVDGYGSFAGSVSNNLAEIVGMINAFKHALEYNIQALQIFTDSEYVLNGITNWYKTWIRNDWIKSDGKEITSASYWKELVELRDRAEQRGIKISFDWVKGHSGDLGNELADKLATIGVLQAKRERVTTGQITTSLPEGYWGYEPARHPFLNNRRMYFNTLAGGCVPGVYYMGEHGKDDELLGKRISDGAYSVVFLSEPDPVVELIRKYQSTMADEIDSICMIRLDQLYKPETHQELTTYGLNAVYQRDPKRLDLHCLDKSPLTRELDPPRLAMRAVESVSELSDRLQQYLDKHPGIVTTDLTGVFYEITTKTPKKGEPSTAMKLKSEYNVGFAALQVDANYAGADGAVASAVITMTLGIDLLDRNALKRLESHNPKVTLITWSEAPGVFRYATVIETDKDKGIWAGAYSNLRVVAPTAAK